MPRSFRIQIHPGCGVEFVTFHIALGSGGTIHPNQTLEHNEYLANIDLMLTSARMFHPRMKATVLTDMHTDLAGISFSVRRVAMELNSRQLMLERAIAELRYVVQSELSTPMILLDSDILINGSLVPLCAQEFDVALTWRANRDMPINGGFLVLNNLRPEVSKNFFKRYVSLYREKYAEKADWFGDQLALRDCIGLSHEQMADREVVEVDGCRVRRLPCESYNFSPHKRYRSFGSNLSEKVVLHFKGQRKRLMVHFWNAWLNPVRSPLPWVKLNGWLERRWLRRQLEQERHDAMAKNEKWV